MDKKMKSYLTIIQEQVKADHFGEIPKNLELTITNYAAALELRDVYRERVIANPLFSLPGSMGQESIKINPLCNLLYQQEVICQSYAKMLGLTAAKAAMKTDPASADADQLSNALEATKASMNNPEGFMMPE